MIRLSRLADYGVVLMTYVAASGARQHTAAAAAAATRIPEPTVSKILKVLARARLLDSQRGINGGYALARAAEEISVADIIAALDGPITLTECLEVEGGACSLETICPTRVNWQKINDAVSGALGRITLADMADPFASFVPAGTSGGRAVAAKAHADAP